MSSKIRYFIPLAIAITLIYGFIYAAVQQVYRQNANDPQIETSEALADSISSGERPDGFLIGPGDISKSLYPFVIVYDNSGKVLNTGATLDGKTPEIPQGVLEFAKSHGQNKVTWQPKEGVRIATVVTYYNSSNSAGFVLAGKNLREVEKRVDALTLHVATAWLITLIATFLATIVFIPSSKKK